MSLRLIVPLTAAIVALAATECRAQTSPTAGSALRDILTSLTLVDSEYEALLNVLERQTTTFPIGSSSAGFTYSFDPQLGLPVRRTKSFGPMFAERPLTAGLHKLSTSLTFQQTTWESIAGFKLKDGLTTNFIFGGSDSLTGNAEGDLARTHLNLKTSRTVFGANYGLTDRLEAGVLVPFGEAKVSGDSTYTITDLTKQRVIYTENYKYEGTSSGIGDITLRGKMELRASTSFNLAAGLDVRLPTGDEEKLLGAGATQTKVMVIGAVTQGSFTHHFNVGYTFVPGSKVFDEMLGPRGVINQPDEFNYTFGGDMAVGNKVTVAADLIGRSLLHSANLVREVDVFESSVFSERGTVNLLLGAVGGKILVGNQWLLTGSIAFPLNNSGVKPGLTPVIGFERAF